MTRIDRYILAQLLGPVGFFALVFTGILWLTQSLRFLDTVVVNNQSSLVFLEFSSLVLPQVMLFVIPLSIFSAALYTLNRLYVENELVVMLMSGRSPWALARPLLMFGAFGMAALFAVSLYLYPVSTTQLGDRLSEVRQELANSLIVEGRFVHPTDNVTLYIRDTNQANEMAGIFIHDARNPVQPVTYSAERAVFVGDTNLARLVMFDGAIQRLDTAEDSIDTVAFDRFAYDLTAFLTDANTRRRRPREFFAHEGVAPSDEMLAATGGTLGEFVSEAHDKIAAPILTLTLPLIALGAILAGSFRRNGFALRISAGVGLMVLVQALAIAAKAQVEAAPARWAVLYAPAGISATLGIALLWFAERKLRRRPASGGAQ